MMNPLLVSFDLARSLLLTRASYAHGLQWLVLAIDLSLLWSIGVAYANRSKFDQMVLLMQTDLVLQRCFFSLCPAWEPTIAAFLSDPRTSTCSRILPVVILERGSSTSRWIYLCPLVLVSISGTESVRLIWLVRLGLVLVNRFVLVVTPSVLIGLVLQRWILSCVLWSIGVAYANRSNFDQ